MIVKPKFRSMVEAKRISAQRRFIGSCEAKQLEAISKIGFWFKIAAAPSFPR